MLSRARIAFASGIAAARSFEKTAAIVSAPFFAIPCNTPCRTTVPVERHGPEAGGDHALDVEDLHDVGRLIP